MPISRLLNHSLIRFRNLPLKESPLLIQFVLRLPSPTPPQVKYHPPPQLQPWKLLSASLWRQVWGMGYDATCNKAAEAFFHGFYTGRELDATFEAAKEFVGYYLMNPISASRSTLCGCSESICLWSWKVTKSWKSRGSFCIYRWGHVLWRWQFGSCLWFSCPGLF